MENLYKERAINRLYDEWLQHGKIIVAVDFDDTISPWRMHTWDHLALLGVARVLSACQHTGIHLVCFTACNEDRYPEIKEVFKTLGLRLDAINQNPIDLPYGNNTKIYANIFLDDRAGLSEALEILETALYRYRGYQQQQQNLDDVA